MKLFLVIALSCGAGLIGFSVEQKPVKTVPMIVDALGPAPDTLDQAITSASAVVLGVVHNDRNHPSNADNKTPRHIITFEVTAVIVSDGRILGPGSIEVVRFGGDVDRGDHIDRSLELGFPKFKQFEQLVLFLHWNPVSHEYYLDHGADGAFVINADGTVQAEGDSRLSREQRGKVVNLFLANLKDTATKLGR